MQPFPENQSSTFNLFGTDFTQAYIAKMFVVESDPKEKAKSLLTSVSMRKDVGVNASASLL